MIIGHSDKIRDLKRLAKDGNLSHGYVFWGPAMIGKRLVAEALANFLETGSFETPKLLQDCLVIKPSGNTIGIDQVREIKNFLWQKPAISSRRTLVIDDADFMTADAQNALLKIAEEPPASALIVLVTDDPDALNPTVFSRLQKIYFSPVPQEELARWAEARFGKNPAAKKAVVQSAGRPGLLSALLTDGPFLESLEAAEKLSRAPASAPRGGGKKNCGEQGFYLGNRPAPRKKRGLFYMCFYFGGAFSLFAFCGR